MKHSFHTRYITDIQCNNFNEIDNCWWRPRSVETCNEEGGWLDSRLHSRRKYVCTEIWISISTPRLCSISSSHLSVLYLLSFTFFPLPFPYFSARIRVRFQLRSRGTSRQNGSWVGLLEVLQFTLPILFPPSTLCSLIALSMTPCSLDTDSSTMSFEMI
jgi:hypothetical protein